VLVHRRRRLTTVGAVRLKFRPLRGGGGGRDFTGIGKGTTNTNRQSGGFLNGTRRSLITGLGLGIGAVNHSLLGVLAVIATLPTVRGACPDPGLALLCFNHTGLCGTAALGAVSSALFGATKEQLPDAREDG
jgi:hypothetical protein